MYVPFTIFLLFIARRRCSEMAWSCQRQYNFLLFVCFFVIVAAHQDPNPLVCSTRTIHTFVYWVLWYNIGKGHFNLKHYV